MKLEKQVALVTGASRGIGKAIALRLASEGARVGVNYNTGASAAQKVVQQVTAAGGEALALRADVSDEKQGASMVQELLDRWQRIDILVNNAGIRKDKLLLRMTAEEWDSVINVNLRSAFVCSKHVLPHMIRQRRGRIINLSSVIALRGNSGQANYAASKAGLIGFTKAIAREVASRDITVNTLAPGYINTSMVEELSEEFKNQVLARIPMSRFGMPEDVASMVAFLCTDEAGYITGQVISIDGGLAI